jgi:PhnB protein
MARRAKRATTKKRAARRPKQRATQTTANPQGLRTVTPYLVIDGASKAIDFYKKAFGAKEIDRSPMPDGTLMHATIQIGDSIIMMSDEMPGADSKAPTSAGATTVNLHIYSKAVDKLWNQAINAGAIPTLPLENQFWGERYGKLQDPFGHIWSVSMVVKMSEQEKEAKRQAAFAMMAQGEHPGSEKSWS